MEVVSSVLGSVSICVGTDHAGVATAIAIGGPGLDSGYSAGALAAGEKMKGSNYYG